MRKQGNEVSGLMIYILVKTMRVYTNWIAESYNIKGQINIQFAIREPSGLFV